MRIRDWSSDLCSSDLAGCRGDKAGEKVFPHFVGLFDFSANRSEPLSGGSYLGDNRGRVRHCIHVGIAEIVGPGEAHVLNPAIQFGKIIGGIIGLSNEVPPVRPGEGLQRSEEHTSELQSLMRISYAVFCLKKKK